MSRPRPARSPQQHVGRVKFFDSTKGFGFIEDFDAGEDLYVHVSNLADGTLRGGDVVRFAVAPSPRKRGSNEARDVHTLSQGEVAALATQYEPLDEALRDLRPGKVKFYDAEKGFGFAWDLVADDDVFIGRHAVLETIRDEDVILFRRRASRRKPGQDVAAEVRPVADFEAYEEVFLRRLPLDLEAWKTPPPVVKEVLPRMSEQGCARFAERALSAWTPLEGSGERAAAVALEQHLRESGKTEAAANFQAAALHGVATAERAWWWEQGWDQAFDAATVAASLDRAAGATQLRRLNDDQYEEVIAHALRGIGEQGLDAFERVLDIAITAAFPARTSWGSLQPEPPDTPAARRERRGWTDHPEARPDRYEQTLRSLPPIARGPALYLRGYSDGFDVEAAIQSVSTLRREDLAVLLEAEGLPEEERGRLIKAWVADGSRAHDVEEVTWVLTTARSLLSDGEAQAVEDSEVERASDERWLELWREGVTAQLRPEVIVEQVHALSRDELDRAFPAVPSTQVGEALRARLFAALAAAEEEGDEVAWALRAAGERLDTEAVTSLQAEVLPRLSDELRLRLWASGVIDEVPTGIIRARLHADGPATLGLARYWVSKGRIAEDAMAALVRESVAALPPVEGPGAFERLRSHLHYLLDVGPEGPRGEAAEAVAALGLAGPNAGLARLYLWLHGWQGFDFDAYRGRVVLLPPREQVRFIRKLFLLHQRGAFTVTAGRLREISRIDTDLSDLAAQHLGVQLDLSAEVLIQSLVRLQQEGTFSMEGDLLRFAYAGLAGDPDRPLALTAYGLFDGCPGRMEDEFAPPEWERGKIVDGGGEDAPYRILFGYDPELVAAVKRLPGRRYDPETKTWTVPREQEPALRAFSSEYGFPFEKEGVGFKTANKHFFRFRRTSRPTGVTYCEGRAAPQPHKFHDRPFWWCANRFCFQNHEERDGEDAVESLTFEDLLAQERDDRAAPSDEEAWEAYTLLDLIGILGYDCDERRKGGEVIPQGEYYKFVGTVNRFQRLLEHLQCRSCDGALYPAETSNYGYYRVTQFWCDDERCSGYHERVYLHHCLNGKCNAIIDSRDTHQCPNGWWICTNEACGCCCSHKTNMRRRDNLQETRGFVPAALADEVDAGSGHLEQGVAFCYGCGGEMNEDARTGRFHCRPCGIFYDRNQRW